MWPSLSLNKRLVEIPQHSERKIQTHKLKHVEQVEGKAMASPSLGKPSNPTCESAAVWKSVSSLINPSPVLLWPFGSQKVSVFLRGFLLQCFQNIHVQICVGCFCVEFACSPSLFLHGCFTLWAAHIRKRGTETPQRWAQTCFIVSSSPQ